MAVNCLVRPVTTLGLIGVTTMTLKMASVTVKVAEADEPLNSTVMTDVPAVTPVARPDALSTVATLEVPEVQSAKAVTSTDVPSDKVPVAINCWDMPTGIERVAGVTPMDTRVVPSAGESQLPEEPPPITPEHQEKTQD